MRLQPDAFNKFLAGIGQKISWRKSHACPCVDKNSGAAKSSCPVCGGKGRFWDAAVGGVIGIASQKVQARWAQSGRYEAGDAVVVIPENVACYDAGKFDRFTMLNSTDRFSLPLTRGAPSERILFQVEKVDRVFSLTNGGLPLVEWGIPTVAANGTLSWSSGAPTTGVQYAIEGTKFSEYYVFDNLPSDRNQHSGARLPRNAVLRNFDLYSR